VCSAVGDAGDGHTYPALQFAHDDQPDKL
jgi:hypothetical protein